jgi:hypothetical protein
MFNTTFNYNSSYSQYELKIDGSKFDVTIAWLRKFQVRFNATAFSRYVLIEIISASDEVIHALCGKFLVVSLEHLFQQADEVGNKYLTEEEVNAYQEELQAV